MIVHHLYHWEASGRLVQRHIVLPSLEVKTAASEASHLVDATFMDGAVVVQMLNHGIAKTFLDYVGHVLLPYMYQKNSRIPLVFILLGMYIKQRGTCVRRRFVTSVVIPKILTDFVHVDQNKAELFSFISHQVTLLQRTIKLMATMCLKR